MNIYYDDEYCIVIVILLLRFFYYHSGHLCDCVDIEIIVKYYHCSYCNYLIYFGEIKKKHYEVKEKKKIKNITKHNKTRKKRTINKQ